IEHGAVAGGSPCPTRETAGYAAVKRSDDRYYVRLRKSSLDSGRPPAISEADNEGTMREHISLDQIAEKAGWRLGDIEDLATKLGVPVIEGSDGIDPREYVSMKNAAVLQGAIQAKKDRATGWVRGNVYGLARLKT